MDETKTIAWQLIVETKGIQENTKAAAGSLDSLTTIAKGATAALAAVVASKIVGDLIELSDAYAEFQNRLRLVTTTQEELAAVSQKVAEAAVDNGASIEKTAELYNNFRQALASSGASANDTLRVVDLLEKSVKLSGSTVEQASGELQHFATALQSGSIGSRDITTLLKSIPELGTAIASGLGVSIQQMKQLAADGKLTTQAVMDALAKSAPEIQEQYAKLSPTFKEAFTTLKDGFTVALGQFDQGLGLSSAITEGMVALGKALVALGPKLKTAGLEIQDFYTQAGIHLKTFFDSIPLADALDGATDAADGAREALSKLADEEKIALLQADLDAASRMAANRRIADSLDDRTKAQKQATQADIDAAKAYRAELEGLSSSIANTAIKQDALNLQLALGAAHQREGAIAASDYTVTAEAQLKVTEKIADAIRTNKPFTDAQVASMRAAAEAAANQTIAANHLNTALANTNKMWDDQATALEKSNKAMADATIQSHAIALEITQGEEASKAYTQQQDAEQAALEKVQEQLKAGLPLTAEYIAGQLALAQQTAAVTSATTNQVAGWAKVKSAINANLTPQESARQALKELTDAFAALSDEQKAALDPSKLAAYNLAVKQLSAQTKDNFGLMHDSVAAFANDFTNFLTDGAFNFGQFAQSIIKDIAKLIIQFEILKFIGGAFPGLGIGPPVAAAPAGAAKGAAYTGGNIIPFATGGVVSSPVTFGLAGGRTGLMGEAGPEAVMPLQRMPGGDLGVKGSSPSIQIINQTGVTARARISQNAERTSVILEAANLGAQMAEDRMTRSMRSGYGPTATAMQGTYQLRRRGG